MTAQRFFMLLREMGACIVCRVMVSSISIAIFANSGSQPRLEANKSMGFGAIDEIAAAEENAVQAKEAALKNAETRASEARRAGEEAYGKAVARAEADAAGARADAEARAKVFGEELRRKTEGECEDLRAIAGSRMDEAAAVIVERILKS